ncbi:hypothetical protein EMIT0P294_50135 [Pseudomonas sp. IT-P294]
MVQTHRMEGVTKLNAHGTECTRMCDGSAAVLGQNYNCFLGSQMAIVLGKNSALVNRANAGTECNTVMNGCRRHYAAWQ